MHERSFPPLRPAAALASLLLALVATGPALTRAQAPDPSPPAPDTAAQDTVVEDEEPAGGPAAADAAATEQAPGPLEDYEASEQISEDLSVSFPVDI